MVQFAGHSKTPCHSAVDQSIVANVGDVPTLLPNSHTDQSSAVCIGKVHQVGNVASQETYWLLCLTVQPAKGVKELVLIVDPGREWRSEWGNVGSSSDMASMTCSLHCSFKACRKLMSQPMDLKLSWLTVMMIQTSSTH